MQIGIRDGKIFCSRDTNYDFALKVEQLHKIFKLCGSPSEDYWRKAKLPHSTVFKPHQPYKPRLAETFKDLPAVAVGLMGTLLNIDPACRGTAAAALKSEVCHISSASFQYTCMKSKDVTQGL